MCKSPGFAGGGQDGQAWNRLIHNTSKIVVLNAQAEVYQKRKRLNFNVENCKILPMNTPTYSKEPHNLKLNNQNISIESEVTCLAEQFNFLGNNEALIKSRLKTGGSSFAESLGRCELMHVIRKQTVAIVTLTAILFNRHEQDYCKLSNLDQTKKKGLS